MYTYIVWFNGQEGNGNCTLKRKRKITEDITDVQDSISEKYGYKNVYITNIKLVEENLPLWKEIIKSLSQSTSLLIIAVWMTPLYLLMIDLLFWIK